jgi:hypothetical protein
MTPVVRNILLVAGTTGSTALGVAMFMASRGGDITAPLNQVNVVVADVTKLIALAMPLILGGYQIIRAASTKARVDDAQSDPKVEGVIVNDRKLAAELGPKVVTPEEIHLLPATARAIGALSR